MDESPEFLAWFDAKHFSQPPESLERLRALLHAAWWAGYDLALTDRQATGRPEQPSAAPQP